MRRTEAFVALASIMGVASCAAIAGLDGEFSVGDTGTGGATTGTGGATTGTG
ncbi:MAG: CapA family protein, partial [Deltaproteobacteria bacterium]|nr:CapA family protein [Deltaproteobacteria bacterium]MBW2534815.1 CapA family protein [Deltaproteobacteria bacterium]